MYQPLKGSFNNHAHLFKLVHLLTFFTLKLRIKYPDITTKDILIRWLASSKEETIHLKEHSDSLIDDINRIVMPFVTVYVYDKENDKFNLYGLTTPEEIKKEILHIINEYWLPF